MIGFTQIRSPHPRALSVPRTLCVPKERDFRPNGCWTPLSFGRGAGGEGFLRILRKSYNDRVYAGCWLSLTPLPPGGASSSFRLAARHTPLPPSWWGKGQGDEGFSLNCVSPNSSRGRAQSFAECAGYAIIKSRSTARLTTEHKGLNP